MDPHFDPMRGRLDRAKVGFSVGFFGHRERLYFRFKSVGV